MNNNTPNSTNLLNQKRNSSTPDEDCEMENNSSHSDTFTIYRPMTKYSPFVSKEKKMSIDTYDEAFYNNNNNKVGCNCKHSQCLKRYCECFSRMKFCDGSICSCKNCYNTLEREKERSEAIHNYMQKSPISFKKINIYENQVACSCKKSFCLKKYCECFQSGMKCTSSCKCSECRNKTYEKKLFSVSGGNSSANTNTSFNTNKRERYYSVETDNICKQMLEWKTIHVEPEQIIIDNYNINQANCEDNIIGMEEDNM